jgi:hypothetical protein
MGVLIGSVRGDKPVDPGAPAGAREIFVSQSLGNDSNQGTSAASPKKTINSALQVLPALTGGDFVTVLDGTYAENVIVGVGGTSDASRFILRAKNRSLALIRPTGGNHCIQVQKDYVRVQGFDVASKAILFDGIAADWLDGAAGGRGVHHVAIEDCVAHDCTISGIRCAYGDYYTIEGNETYGNCNDSQQANQGDGIRIYQPRASDAAAGYHIVCRRNKSHDNLITRLRTNDAARGFYTADFPASEPNHVGGSGICVDDGRQPSFGTPYPHQILVENNLCYRNGNNGVRVSQSDGVIVQNNTCVSDNVDDLSLTIWRDEISMQFSKNSKVANNVTALLGPLTITIRQTGSVQAKGCLGDRDTPTTDENTGTEYYNNGTWNGTPGSQSVGQAATGAQNASLTSTTTPYFNKLGVNPSFLDPVGDNYRLATSSALIDAGTALFGLPATDLLGNPRAVGLAVDPGCYEQQTTGVSSGFAQGQATVQGVGVATTAGGSMVTAASVAAFGSSVQKVTTLPGWPAGKKPKRIVSQGSNIHGYVRRAWRPSSRLGQTGTNDGTWMDFQAGWRKTSTPDQIVVLLDDDTTQVTINIAVTHVIPGTSGRTRTLHPTAGSGDYTTWSQAISDLQTNDVLVVRAPSDPTVYSTSGPTGGPTSTVDGVKIVADPTDLAAGRRPRIHVQGGIWAKYADQLNAGNWTDVSATNGLPTGTLWWTTTTLGTPGTNVGCAFRTKAGRLRRCYTYTNTSNMAAGIALLKLKDTNYTRIQQGQTDAGAALYTGPGIYLDTSANRLYIRLTPVTATTGALQVHAGVGKGNNPPWPWVEEEPADTDPNKVQLYISSTNDNNTATITTSGDGNFGVMDLSNRLLRINGTSNWLLENLDFVGGGDTIQMRNCSGTTIRGCRFLGWAPPHFKDGVGLTTCHRRHFMLDVVDATGLLCERCEFWGGTPYYLGADENKVHRGGYPLGANATLFYCSSGTGTFSGTFRNCIIEHFISLAKSGGSLVSVKFHNNYMQYVGEDGLIIMKLATTGIDFIRNHMCSATFYGPCDDTTAANGGTLNVGYNLILNFRPAQHYSGYMMILNSGENTDQQWMCNRTVVSHENWQYFPRHRQYNNTSVASPFSAPAECKTDDGDGTMTNITNNASGCMLWPNETQYYYTEYQSRNNILALRPNGTFATTSTATAGPTEKTTHCAVVLDPSLIGWKQGAAVTYSMDYNIYHRGAGIVATSGTLNAAVTTVDSQLTANKTERGRNNKTDVFTDTGQENHGLVSDGAGTAADPMFVGVWEAASVALTQPDSVLFDKGFWCLQSGSPAAAGGDTTDRTWPDVDFGAEITYLGNSFRGCMDPAASAIEQLVGPLGPLPSGL